jgi:ABC-type molybdenum transport system ATPase subunit/photorepair protein PhrA
MIHTTNSIKIKVSYSIRVIFILNGWGLGQAHFVKLLIIKTIEMKNILTIDIDTERDKPIKVNKNIGVFPEEHEYDDMVRKDVKDLVLTGMYLSSMLEDEQSELTLLNEINNMVKNRMDEIKRNSEEA